MSTLLHLSGQYCDTWHVCDVCTYPFVDRMTFCKIFSTFLFSDFLINIYLLNSSEVSWLFTGWLVGLKGEWVAGWARDWSVILPSLHITTKVPSTGCHLGMSSSENSVFPFPASAFVEDAVRWLSESHTHRLAERSVSHRCYGQPKGWKGGKVCGTLISPAINYPDTSTHSCAFPFPKGNDSQNSLSTPSLWDSFFFHRNQNISSLICNELGVVWSHKNYEK